MNIDSVEFIRFVEYSAAIVKHVSTTPPAPRPPNGPGPSPKRHALLLEEARPPAHQTVFLRCTARAPWS